MDLREVGDDIPVPTMSTASTAKRPGTGLLSSGIHPNVTCNYCKKPGHVKDHCRKLKRKEEQRRNDGQDTKKNIQNVQLATKLISRRNGVRKELQPTSSPKTLRWRTPNKTNCPPAKMTPTVNRQLQFSKTQKIRFATTPI